MDHTRPQACQAHGSSQDQEQQSYLSGLSQKEGEHTPGHETQKMSRFEALPTYEARDIPLCILIHSIPNTMPYS